jgi:hypothetical protein
MKQEIQLGVILPSRGLVFAEVEQALSENLRGYNFTIYRSWDLKIPECENVLVEKALRNGATHLLSIEEDTVIPPEGLSRLLMLDSDIACIDYGVGGWSTITKDKTTKEILWCALGCTLIKRAVFDAVEKPWFRDDKKLLLNFWPEIRWVAAGAQAYGGQDIYFCMKAREKGFKIAQAMGECKHLQLEQLGIRERNNGLHSIIQKPTISKWQTL